MKNLQCPVSIFVTFFSNLLLQKQIHSYRWQSNPPSKIHAFSKYISVEDELATLEGRIITKACKSSF